MRIELFKDEEIWKTYLKELRSWMGTPYRHLQGVKGRGADCTLFIAHAMKNVGLLTDVKHEYYPKDWNIHTREEVVLEGAFRHFRENLPPGLTVDRFEENARDGFKLYRGDLITFKTNGSQCINHASVVLDDFDGRCQMSIQAINTRVVDYFPLGKFWLKRQRGGFRFYREI